MVAPKLNKLSRKSKLVLQKSVGGYLEIRTSECPDFNNQEDVKNIGFLICGPIKKVNCDGKLILILRLC